MVKLHGCDIFEKITPQRFLHENNFWHPAAIHEWKCVVGETGLEAGNEPP